VVHVHQGVVHLHQGVVQPPCGADL
jgi:hypothetical protein